jgi:hypothetical protein
MKARVTGGWKTKSDKKREARSERSLKKINKKLAKKRKRGWKP